MGLVTAIESLMLAPAVSTVIGSHRYRPNTCVLVSHRSARYMNLASPRADALVFHAGLARTNVLCESKLEAL